MGVSFVVESIITHPSRRPPGPEERYIFQRDQLASICTLFGWSAPPWKEPSEIRGTSSSANYTRWQPILDLALYAELYTDKINTLSSNDLIELAINVESRHKDIYNVPWPPVKGHRFTHLIYHHKTTACWLPHDFERPQFISTVISEDPGQYDFSIGSSYRLMQEMKRLCEICDGIVAVRDPLATVGNRTWSDIQYLCCLIHQAAQESLTLNLPLQVFF